MLVLRADKSADVMRDSDAGLILSSCRKRTSGQSCREREARSEVAGPGPDGGAMSSSCLCRGLKYDVMGTAEAGMKGWMPLMFQENIRTALSLLLLSGISVKTAVGGVLVVVSFFVESSLTANLLRLMGGGLTSRSMLAVWYSGYWWLSFDVSPSQLHSSVQ